MFELLFFFWFLLFGDCLNEDESYDEPLMGIVNGNNAEENQWNFVVSIGYDVYRRNYFTFRCGGVIADACHILTAAHCVHKLVDPEKIKLIRVVISNMKLPQETGDQDQYLFVEDLIVHPNFVDGIFGSDLALLKLNSTIDFYGKDYKARCFPRPKPNDTINTQTCLSMGWGKTITGFISPILQELFLPILENGYCQQKANIFNSTVSLCAGYPQGGRDTCSGDSGSPLVCPVDNGDGNYRFVLYAIASYGEGCAKPGHPGYYVRMSYFYDWVERMRFDNLSDF